MNTKLLLTFSAVFLGILGVFTAFLPKEIAIYLGSETSDIGVLALQLLSAAFLGLAMLNWMSKGVRIGGIYNRPVAIANFTHFGIGAITLLKIVFDINANKAILIVLTVVYCILALCYSYVFMTNPVTLTNPEKSET